VGIKSKVNLALLLLLASCAGQAEESNWNPSWDGTLYGYANATTLRADSVLNPNNQIANLAKRTDAAELRLNLKAENEGLRFTARPVPPKKMTAT
jgi:hypothetical protein